MSNWDDFVLASPPAGARARELWLQHAAGKIYFENVREYARRQVDPALSETSRAAAFKGIDDAVYGLMMVLDGVSCGLRGSGYGIALQTKVQLWRSDSALIRAADGDKSDWVEGVVGEEALVQELDLSRGDGMCMGYHMWRAGEFGDDPVVKA